MRPFPSAALAAANCLLALVLLTAALAARALPVPPPQDVTLHPIGPTTVNLYTYAYEMVGNGAVTKLLDHLDQSATPDASGQLRIESSLGSSGQGGEATALAAAVPDGHWFGVTVLAPQHFPSPTSAYVGGAAEVIVMRTFRKDSEDAELFFVFSDIYQQGGWEKEFGSKCPPAMSNCQWTMFSSRVLLWGMTGTDPLWTSYNERTIYSVGTSQSDPGYTIEQLGAFGYVGHNNRYGFMSTNVGLSPSFVDIDLSTVGTGDLFVVEHRVWVGAVDTGSHIAPGRGVEARAIDPLSFNGGSSIGYSGLTAWEDLVTPPGQVPEPGGLWAAAALAALASRRRWR